ncbi:MAG: aryl-sulfate sulfotransferase [Clostridiales bacterium]|jgi:arylsulfate sulfotransferase|nr:aryl-sulfate sulfotransferase [Clostridiales bacterium]
MRKLIKTALICLAVIITLAAAGFAVIRSGVLVRPTEKSLARLTEVPEYDILTAQFEREAEILADYNAAEYSFGDPYVILDPYGMNPLSALVMFETDKPADVSVMVQGDDEYSTFGYEAKRVSGRAEIPVIGLYAGRGNIVTLAADYGGGDIETKELTITTEPLPADFQSYSLVTSQPAEMEPGITLFIPCFEHSYTALVDSNAEVRGYLTNTRMAHGTAVIRLENGNYLATGDEYRQLPYNMKSLFEFNWLGKIFKEYEVPNGVHHNIRELPNGDFLCVSNNAYMFQTGTREDVVIIVDRETGGVKKEYDFRGIIDETRDPYHHFHPDVKNVLNIDWMHTNTAIYDETGNAIIVSSPTQSQVISINADTSEINWILGPREGYDSEAARFLKQYLLTPVGAGFEWQWCQHEPEILPDFDSDPDTIDLLLFDNGQSKSFTKEGAVLPENNYSRGVQFRINQREKTVEQIWEYGKERGSDMYATFLGDADYLPITGNRLIDCGGQVRQGETPTDDILGGVFGTTATRSRIVEVTESGEAVFEVAVREIPPDNSAETYQAERMPLYSAPSFDYRLGAAKGERLGTDEVNRRLVDVTPPNFYIGKLSAEFRDIHREGSRLIMDGMILLNGETYMVGGGQVVLRGKSGNVYVYATNTAINGFFFASIDLNEIQADEYSIDIMGAVVADGSNDALYGKRTQGYFRTEYKITKAS